MLLSILVFILVLGVLVFVHELGHFAVAKWTGMRVDEFGIGFPPRLWKRKVGDTLYCLNAIPLGGYVRIHGENPEDRDEDPRSFQRRPIWARIAVIVAGVAMNLLFALVVLSIAFSIGFVSVSQDLTSIPGASVKSSQLIAVQIFPGTPGASAGLTPGDTLTKIVVKKTGEVHLLGTTDSMVSFTRDLQQADTRDITLYYLRDSEERQVEVSLSESGPPLGVGIQSLNTVKLPFWRAPQAAVREIGYILNTTWQALSGFAHKLFFEAKLDETVSGPVGIYQATASAAHQGVMSVIFLMVALSVNLALLNILPIPALDGGKLVFLIIEAIFRRRVIAERVENYISLIGISSLIFLILLVTIKDITKLF